MTPSDASPRHAPRRRARAGRLPSDRVVRAAARRPPRRATAVASARRPPASQPPDERRVESAPSSAPPAATSPTVAEIARLQALVAADPTDADAQRDLGFALLQRVRETADPSLYAPALDAFEAARAARSRTTRRCWSGSAASSSASTSSPRPSRPAGRPSPSRRTSPRPGPWSSTPSSSSAGTTRPTRPPTRCSRSASDLSTLARVSYLAELHGKLDGRPRPRCSRRPRRRASPRRTRPSSTRCSATCSSRPAIRPARPPPTTRALALVPAHAPSLAGEGRLAVGAGDLETAIALFQRAADILPAARIRHRPGRCPDGRRQDRRRGPQRQARPRRDPAVPGQPGSSSTSISPCSRPTTATRPPRSPLPRRPTRRRRRSAPPTPWPGRSTASGATWRRRKRSDEALRLGSRDPLLRYHAGAIAAALGDVADARRDLDLALSTDAGLLRDGRRRGPPHPRPRSD